MKPMQRCTIALIVAIVGLFFTNLTSALGLGEITLNSSLNEPLDAEIRLLQVRDLSKNEIIIRLASREAFQRAGVEGRELRAVFRCAAGGSLVRKRVD